MNPLRSLGAKGIVLLLLVACGPVTATVPPASEEPAAYPLAEIGPYHVGFRKVAYQDDSRGSRQVSTTMWYPAVPPADPTMSVPTHDAEPDRSGGPYPLILSSTKVAEIFAPFLVSHGFTWASVDGIDSYMVLYEGAI